MQGRYRPLWSSLSCSLGGQRPILSLTSRVVSSQSDRNALYKQGLP
jgi:hypothetical protein